MNELSPKAKAILARAAQHAPADPQLAARVRAAIDAQLAAGTVVAATSTLGVKVFGGVLVIAAVSGGLLWWPDASQPVEPVAVVQPNPPTLEPEPLPPPPPPEVAPALPVAPRDEVVRHRPVRRREVPMTADVPAPPEPVIDALEAERAAVLQARQRLDAGDAGAALVILSEAEDRFGAGNFGMERRSLGARAECARGDRAAAQRLIDALPPRSPLRLAAERSCEHTDPPPAGHSGDR